MTELKYRYDPPLVRGLYCVYMAGSIECAFSQHQDCMEIDGCLFHKGASGCRIEYFYSDKCRSEQAATVIRALAESNRDFPEEIFVADPEYEYNSDVWVDLNEEQKDALRKAYAEAREKLYGVKKVLVVDPGHDEGSRAAETLCAVQEGTLVVQAVVDTNDISPNLNEDVILAQDNPSNPLLESTKAFKQQEILESGLQQRRDGEAAVDKEMSGRSLVDILKTFRNRGSTEIKFTKEDWDNRKPQTEEDRKEMEELHMDLVLEGQRLYLDTREDKSIEQLPAYGGARVSEYSEKKDAYIPDLMEKPKPYYSIPGSMLGMAVGGMLGAVAGDFRENGGVGSLAEKPTEHVVDGHTKAVNTALEDALRTVCDVYGKESSIIEESHNITRKGIKSLMRRCGLDGKSRKRLRKKQEQVINQRDRKFRDRTRKLQKLLEYHIRSLEFVFQGPPFGNKNPGIAMDRRYAFPEMHKGITEQIKCNTGVFLGLE